ncbi:MAG: phage tail tube protein [Campylobacteraceae bacterium]
MSRVLSKAAVLIKTETTPGVYETPNQVIKLESLVLPNVEMDNVEISNYGFFSGTNDSITISDWGKMNFDIVTSLYKSLSFYDNLFAISNLKKTATTTPYNGFVFTPETHSNQTASVDIVLPDRVFRSQGAKASFKMEGKVGDKVNVTFNVQSSFKERVIGTQAITDVPSEECMIIRRLGGITINDININLSEFSFDMGNDIAYSKFTNIGEFHMKDYNPKLVLKMRLEDSGDDGFNELIAGATMDFIADLKDINGDVIWRLKIPKAKLSKQPDFEDNEGIFVISRDYNAISINGDDNFELFHFTH